MRISFEVNYNGKPDDIFKTLIFIFQEANAFPHPDYENHENEIKALKSITIDNFKRSEVVSNLQQRLECIKGEAKLISKIEDESHLYTTSNSRLAELLAQLIIILQERSNG